MRRGLIVLSMLCTPLLWIPAASTQTQRPNILVIFGDDVGLLNVSAYGRGVIGYTTPNMIASPGKVPSSPTTTASRAVLPGALHSSLARSPSGQAYRRSVCPAHHRDCRRKTRPSRRC